MIGGKIVVNVWDKRYEVSYYQKSKSVWIATGEYMGVSHSTKDATKGAAIKRWQEWARYKGG